MAAVMEAIIIFKEMVKYSSPQILEQQLYGIAEEDSKEVEDILFIKFVQTIIQ
jgi:hypothetical protein